jgi:hypothetical protein
MYCFYTSSYPSCILFPYLHTSLCFGLLRGRSLHCARLPLREQGKLFPWSLHFQGFFPSPALHKKSLEAFLPALLGMFLGGEGVICWLVTSPLAHFPLAHFSKPRAPRTLIAFHSWLRHLITLHLQHQQQQLRHHHFRTFSSLATTSLSTLIIIAIQASF